MIDDLRILIVDDTPSDAELIRRELHRAGIGCHTRSVGSRAEFEAALHEDWDLLLVDYTIPDLPGEESIALARRRTPATPVIFVTGTIGEDHAVELIRLGATDYVLKDRLSRLGPVVRRALAEAEEHAQRIRLEARLREAERLETIGRLAGGVAHDFNNILMAADGYARLMIDELDRDSPAVTYAEEVQRSLERAFALTNQLLSLARRQPLQRELLNPAVVVLELMPMLQQLAGGSVEVTYRSDPEVMTIEANRTEFERVILNLVVNARDAMPDGGRISIAVTAQEVDRTGDWATFDLDPGPYAVIEVADSGTGMTDDVREHVFEPFYTTKPLGVGTGLGLATVQGIVRQAGGFVALESSPGAGSTFRILWPKFDGVVPAQRVSAAIDPGAPVPSRILLVDDDEAIRRLVRRMLEEHRYVVMAVASGEAALAIPIDSVDLLLSDVVMPGMSGFELAARVHAVRPSLPVVFMTGYVPDGLPAGAPSEATILTKPFKAVDALAAIRTELGASRDAVRQSSLR